MVERAIEALKGRLFLIEGLMRAAESDMESLERQEVRQAVLVEDIKGLYHNMAKYLALKDKMFYSEEFVLERGEIEGAILPYEQETFKMLYGFAERVGKGVLTEEQNIEINNYIAEHPILSERLGLRPLYRM